MEKRKFVGDLKLIDTNTGATILEVNKSNVSMSISDAEEGVCQECGNLFLKTHGSQRFCPPAEELKRSRCRKRYNHREYLKRNEKYKTGDDLLKNQDIRKYIKESGLKQWMVADVYGINEGNFSRLLRKELDAEQKEDVFASIEEAKEEFAEQIK